MAAGMTITIGEVAGHHFHGQGDLQIARHAACGEKRGYLMVRTRLVDRAAFDYDPQLGWQADRWFEWKVPMNSKQKGNRGERLGRDYLKSLGFGDARRTQQYSGTEGPSDVVCPLSLPDLHIEVKFGTSNKGKRMDLGCEGLTEALDQAKRDAGQNPWCVLWKPDRKPWRLSWRNTDGITLTACGDLDITVMLRKLADSEAIQ